MSKSLGQTLGGVVGGVIGFIGTGGNLMGALKGFAIGSSIGGMIDPPPGPDLKGPTLEDKSFNSAAYGASLATLHGTIAHTGSIIYLENNEYKAVAKKQKTGSKGGGSKGSYTTTTYYATFAVAVGEAMPGSAPRRIWAGGKLIYSFGLESDDGSIEQSVLAADGFSYYDGTQTEPDSRMEAVLGVGNCPSYEGTAYIIFYDFDLTEYGNGLQGCPIKVEVSESGMGFEFYEGFETISINSTVHAGSFTNGVPVGVTSSTDVLEIVLYGFENAWRISPSDGWRSRISIVTDDDPDSRIDIGSITEYATKAEAQANFPVGVTITGGTKYTFFINDFPFNNNSGIMRFSVPSMRDVEVAKKTPKLLSNIVESIFIKAGLEESFYDLSELDDEVHGYKITDASSARGALGPLQAAYLFDFVEHGYTIKAVKRGGSPVATIPLSDLGARSAGDSPGVLVRRERETDSQLPSYYSLTYLDYNREYDTNTQDANYPSRTSNNRNQSLPVVLTANRAAQLADIFINLAWMERDTYSFSLPQKYFYLKPADVISVEIAAGLYSVMRIGAINYSADQRLEISAKRAEAAVYQSAAVGIDVEPPSESIPLITNANTVILDLPAITDDVTGYGFGVAMNGSVSWPGGALLRSIDTGQTYDAIQAFTANCTLAEAVSVLPAGDYFVIDRASELTITVVAGEFFSITESQLLTGKHYCAYGVDGRWEIIQYANATVNIDETVTLSIFVRGLFGTEWAGDLHQVGDMVVLLDDPDVAFVGADAVALNAPRKFKGVTTGQDAQLIDAIDFTYRGTNLKPLSPVNVTGTLVSEVWTISCAPRTRMASNQWSTGIAAPIGETALLFEFEFYEGAVFKKMYQSATETFVYSPANQLADFGYLPTTLTVKIYQISSVVGRGFGVQKSLIGVGDIYGDKVSLLLHYNGPNNSVAIIDSSKNTKTITVVGNTKISTANSINGGSSAYFDGSGDYLTVPHSSEFSIQAGDFTLEQYIYRSGSGVVHYLLSKRPAVTSNGWEWRINADNKMQFFHTGGSSLISTGTIPSGQWVYISTVRIANVVTHYINGVASGSASFTAGVENTADTLKIGVASDLSGAMSGYSKDLRITIGQGRYPSDFTPPIQQLPDPT